MKIYFARHGRTSWNDAGKWQGASDIDLDETGFMQAHAIGKRLKREKFVSVYSSDLKRAKSTADVISGYSGVTVTEVPALREVSLGSWEGKTHDEIQGLDGYWEWEKNPDIAPHGGESFRQVYERMVGAVNAIAEKERGDVVIVSHGAAIRLFVCYALSIPLEERMRFIVDNAALITFHYNKEKKRYTLITLNEKAHLEKGIEEISKEEKSREEKSREEGDNYEKRTGKKL